MLVVCKERGAARTARPASALSSATQAAKTWATGRTAWAVGPSPARPGARPHVDRARLRASPCGGVWEGERWGIQSEGMEAHTREAKSMESSQKWIVAKLSAMRGSEWHKA
jgi:hypothetical protein